MRAIACMAANRVIGDKGKLPWKVSGDLKFFKKMTNGCTCIVGRKTFDSLPPLKNRTFVVVTQSRGVGDFPDSVIGTWNSFEQIPLYGDTTWVIGGATIYKTLLPYCSDLYLTVLKCDYAGDTFFPEFESVFIKKEVVEETYEYTIIHYVNKNYEDKLLCWTRSG